MQQGWLRLLVLTLFLAACQASHSYPPEPGEDMFGKSNNFDLVYAVSGGNPAMAARLHVTPDGSAELFLGSTFSLPEGTDTVGHFSADVGSRQWRTINRHIERNNIADMQADGNTMPGFPSAIRTLMLTRDDDVALLSLNELGNQTGIEKLEQDLVKVMNQVAQSPQAAVRAAVAVERDGDKIRPMLTLTHLGSSPLPIILLDDEHQLKIDLIFEQLVPLDANEDMAIPLQVISIDQATIEAWASRGLVANGRFEFTQGDTVTLPLGDVTLPEGDDRSLNIAINFWLPGEGSSIDSVQLQTQRIKFDR